MGGGGDLGLAVIMRGPFNLSLFLSDRVMLSFAKEEKGSAESGQNTLVLFGSIHSLFFSQGYALTGNHVRVSFTSG